MQELDTIRLEALDLAIGQSKYIYCPFCRVTHEAKLSLTRISDGILFNCYRASCGRSGFVPSNSSPGHADKQSKLLVHREYITESIPKPIRKFLGDAYGLLDSTITTEGWTYATAQNRLIMPLRSVIGTQYGTCAKVMPASFGKLSERKVLLHYETNSPLRLHYPLAAPKSVHIVLVEDVISATKLVQLGIPAAALLGTHISTDVITYLAAHYVSLCIALDNDATTKAIKLAQQWELFFKGYIKVVPMKVDPKDTDAEELLKLFK